MEIHTICKERELPREGGAALKVRICLPSPEGGGFARRLRFFYGRLAALYLRYCRRWLRPEEGTALALLEHRVTLNDGRHLSVLLHRREPGLELWYSDCWDVERGEPVKPPAWARGRVASAASALVESCELYLSPGWPEALEKHFSSRRFYMDETGYVVFYQPMTVAPREAGLVAIPLGPGKE